MAIEIKPEKETKFTLPSSFSVFFYYSIILLFLSVSAYLLIFQWSSEMQDQVDSREDLLEQLREAPAYEEKRDIVRSHQDRADNYIEIFQEKTTLENLFGFIESSVHPLTYLEEVRLSIEDGEMMIAGRTLNFNSLEQQHTMFKDFSMRRNVIGWVSEYQPFPTNKEDYITHSDYIEDGVEGWSKQVENWDDFGEVQIFEQLMGDGGVRRIIFSIDEEAVHEDEKYQRFEKNVEIAENGEEKRVSLLRNSIEINSSPISGRRVANIDKDRIENIDKKPLLLTEARQDNYKIQEKDLLEWDWYEISVIERVEPINYIELTDVAEIGGELSVSFDFSIILDPIIFK